MPLLLTAAGLPPHFFLVNPCLLICGLVVLKEIFLEVSKAIIQDSSPYFTHKIAQEAQVMNGCQAVCQQLVTIKEVM